jgi:hypothetical protein
MEVAAGGVTVWGGRVSLRPFKLPLAAPALEAAAEVEGVQLAEVAKLLPWLLDAAQGRLRGRVELAWDAAKGLRVRDGGLDIVRADDASFRLAPSPGLLTGKMPPVFGFLPASWGWARGIGLKNPAYRPLKDIELGKEGLRLEAFQVTFAPDGAEGARAATIHIVGRPTSGALVKQVVMDVNFHGALAEAMGFGLNQEFTGFDFRTR